MSRGLPISVRYRDNTKIMTRLLDFMIASPPIQYSPLYTIQDVVGLTINLATPTLSSAVGIAIRRGNLFYTFKGTFTVIKLLSGPSMASVFESQNCKNVTIFLAQFQEFAQRRLSVGCNSSDIVTLSEAVYNRIL